MPGGRQGLDYIALRIQREPLDQTDLSNGGDEILKAVGNRHTKQGLIGGPRGYFWINPPAVMKSPKLVEFISLNP